MRSKVTITYCAECGYESETVELARALMEEFGQRLSSIEIIPWEEGTFDVSVDGELVHSMRREGGFADPEAVKEAIRRRSSP
jgi:selenoprotein W-related protein